MPEFVWLIILALCLVVEIATLGLVTIWFAGGALVTFFVAMVTDNLLIQVIVFLVVSLVLLFFSFAGEHVATTMVWLKKSKLWNKHGLK